MFLHWILLVIFSLMGIFGLVFNVSEGVFVGAALIPWEVRMILAARGKFDSKLIKVLIAVAAIVGVGFFVLHQLWKMALILLAVQAYIYVVVNKSKMKMEKAREQVSENERDKG